MMHDDEKRDIWHDGWRCGFVIAIFLAVGIAILGALIALALHG